MLYPERGARIKLDDRYEYPNLRGTIVGEFRDAGGETVWTVRRDFDGMEASYPVDVFEVTMTPTHSAERMADRWTIDGCLEAAEALALVGTTRGLEIYQAALIVELYKIYAYENADETIRYDRGGWVSGPAGWDKV